MAKHHILCGMHPSQRVRVSQGDRSNVWRKCIFFVIDFIISKYRVISGSAMLFSLRRVRLTLLQQ